MIQGVSFDPTQQADPTRPKKPADPGVQEAIKVLSLRLPRVVGAQSPVPSALLNAQGSGGNPRVDSVVNQVLNQMFAQGQPPTMGPQAGESGTMPVGGPRFEGVQGNAPLSSFMPQDAFALPPGGPPRIVVDAPWQGDFTLGPGGVPITPPPPFDDGSGQPPAAIAPLPQLPEMSPGTDAPLPPMDSLIEFLRRRSSAPPPR